MDYGLHGARRDRERDPALGAHESDVGERASKHDRFRGRTSQSCRSEREGVITTAARPSHARASDVQSEASLLARARRRHDLSERRLANECLRRGPCPQWRVGSWQRCHTAAPSLREKHLDKPIDEALRRDPFTSTMNFRTRVPRQPSETTIASRNQTNALHSFAPPSRRLPSAPHPEASHSQPVVLARCPRMRRESHLTPRSRSKCEAPFDYPTRADWSRRKLARTDQCSIPAPATSLHLATSHTGPTSDRPHRHPTWSIQSDPDEYGPVLRRPKENRYEPREREKTCDHHERPFRQPLRRACLRVAHPRRSRHTELSNRVRSRQGELDASTPTFVRCYPATSPSHHSLPLPHSNAQAGDMAGQASVLTDWNDQTRHAVRFVVAVPSRPAGLALKRSPQAAYESRIRLRQQVADGETPPRPQPWLDSRAGRTNTPIRRDMQSVSVGRPTTR